MKKVVQYYLGLNVYLQLMPLLFFYILLVKLWVLPTELAGDEDRYLMFANNLLNGFYSPPYPNINLWNGPGYPLFIAPFVALKIPFFYIRLTNAFLLYFALILTFKTTVKYAPKNLALISVIILGIYLPSLQMLRFMITETLSYFLISLICFLVVQYHQHKSLKYLVFSSLSIAYLAMVKVIFGYVIFFITLLILVFCIFTKLRQILKKSLLLFGLSALLCIPYLIYTYSITNKLFYWSNSGSSTLYSMSSPFPDELGDWFSGTELLKNQNHKEFIQKINSSEPLQMDSALKKQGIEYIKNNPKKYVINWIANVSRLFFDFPFSYQNNKVNSLFYIIPGSFVFVLIFISFLIIILNIKKVKIEIIMLLLFFFIYLAVSTLLSTYARMLYISLPFWTLIITYAFTNIITINIYKKSVKENEQS